MSIKEAPRMGRTWDHLSDFVDELETQGELQKISVEVDPRFEIGAICRKLSITRGPAILFQNVRGSQYPVVGQLLASNRRLAMALDVAERDLFREVVFRSKNMISPNLLAHGASQEVAKYGKDVNLYDLPLVTNNPCDGAPYITAGHVILADSELGSNLAIYRMMVHSQNELFLRFNPIHSGWAFLKKAEERGMSTLPVAVAIGVDPAIYIASQFTPGVGVNEMEIAGGLRRKPLDVVKCKTNNIVVPAHADFVLECEMDLPPKTGTEGPFGEFTGYSAGVVKDERVMTVKAITHKKHPIYQNIYVGKPPHEHLYVNALTFAIQAYHDLKPRFPALKAAYAPPSGLSIRLVLQVEERLKYPGMVNNLLASSLMTGGSIWKEFVAVDDDIDIFNDDEISWAILTRAQPDRDIFILPRGRGSSLDPSSDSEGVSSKILIDATRKKDFKGTAVAEPPRDMMEKVEARWKEYGFNDNDRG